MEKALAAMVHTKQEIGHFGLKARFSGRFGRLQPPRLIKLNQPLVEFFKKKFLL